MPRERSPNRDKAFEIYKEHNGNIENREIAKILGENEKVIAVWKQRDKWNEKLNVVQQINESCTTKIKRKKRNKNSKKEESVIQEIIDIDIPELTEKQKLFCLYYIKNFNATMAAIKAGYSKESAHVEGSRLLKNDKVRNYIKLLKGKMTEDLFIDAMDVLNRYIKIAFADMTDFVEFGQEQVPVMGMFGPVMVDNPETGQQEILMQTVNKIKFKSAAEVDGGLICEISEGKNGTKIKLEDRQKALDKLAEYFDLFPDKFRRRIAEEKLKLDKLKVTGEGQEIDQEGINSFINATNKTPDQIKSIFEGEDDETV